MQLKGPVKACCSAGSVGWVAPFGVLMSCDDRRWMPLCEFATVRWIRALDSVPTVTGPDSTALSSTLSDAEERRVFKRMLEQ